MAIDYEVYHSRGRTERFSDVRERVRARTIADVLEAWQLSTRGILLDVGAGEGRYLPIWQRYFPQAQITALDVSDTASRRRAERFPFAHHVVASAESIPLEDASVDAIASVEVIEHVPSGDAMLRECHRVLKPGGWMLLSTPCGNRGSLLWLLALLTHNIHEGREHGLQFGALDDPTHLRRYRSRELAHICDAMGFDTEDAMFNLHGFLLIAGWGEMKVKGKINLGRRSAALERAFENTCDSVALLDWRLFRRLPFGSSMIVLLRKRRGPDDDPPLGASHPPNTCECVARRSVIVDPHVL